MKIVIPMAGRGSRYSSVAHLNPEYRRPKPIINVLGKPMVRWAIESLPFVDLPNRPAETKFKVKGHDLIFICLKEHEEKFKIKKILEQSISPDIQVVLISQVTRGAVETVLAAEHLLKTDEDLIVSDSDHYFNGENLYKTILNKEKDVAGIIPVFLPPDPDIKWSYTLFGKNMYARAVGEKDKKLALSGAYANIGGYYFTNCKVFLDEAGKMIAQNDMYGVLGKKEFYVAPIYQRLLKVGMKIKVAIIPKVWGLGTPADLEMFLSRQH